MSEMNLHSALSLLVFGCLVSCLVIIGVFSYTLLWRAEDAIYRDNFSATANELSDKIMNRANRVAHDGVTMAVVYGTFFPDADIWPNAYVSGFQDIAREFESAQPPHGGVYVMPIVYPEEVGTFEAYVQEQYLQDPSISPTAGYHDFGFGIWADQDNPYHDISGNSTYGSPNKFMTPLLTYLDFYDDHHLWNPHNDYPVVGKGIDGVYACIQAGNVSCQAMLESINDGSKPGLVVVTPMFPRNDPEEIVGFVVTAFLWDTILRGSVARLANDIQMVISVNGFTFTCRFEGSVVFLAGESDLHDRRFSDPHHEYFIYLANTTAANSVVYTFKLYPTKAFYDTYHTSLPLWATILSMSMIFITVMIFIFYDRYVKSDSESKDFLLEEKRRFVRFISHEIRTPLNTAMMGLQLLEEQLKMEKEQERGRGLSTVDSGCAEMKEDEEDDVTQLVGDVKMSAEAALDVLNDLLHYDKIEMGKMKLDIGIVDMWRLIGDTVNMFTIQALKSQVSMKQVTPFASGKLPEHIKDEIRSLRVIGDNIRLAQSCRNLISNALKFSAAGSEVQIVSRYDTHGLPRSKVPELPSCHRCYGSPLMRCGSILLTVQDSGPGMTVEELKQLFGEGVQFQANKLQAGAGSGLGLFISKNIVEMHGGKIWATSEGPGQGSTFCIELPLCKEPVEIEGWDECGSIPQSSPRYLLLGGTGSNSLKPQLPRSDADQSNYSPLHTPGEKPDLLDEEMGASGEAEVGEGGVMLTTSPALKRDCNFVLVVDDAPSNRKLLVKLLERKGFECSTAEDGLECLQQVENNPRIGVIIMDFQMPNVSR
jgi:signal transduction histidine kinase